MLSKDRSPFEKENHERACSLGMIHHGQCEHTAVDEYGLRGMPYLGMFIGRYENTTVLFLSGGAPPPFTARQRPVLSLLIYT